MSRRPNVARWGRAAALVGAAGALMASAGCGVSLQALPKLGGQSGPVYPLRATFADVLNLPAEAQVRSGVAVVGEVSSISVSNFQAHLVLDIRRGVRLPVGTTAQVRFDSPLGDEFVLLQPPAGATDGPWLTAGAVLDETQTSSAPTIEDTLTALAAVLNGGGLDQLQTIVSQLNAAFNGNQTQIRALLSDVDQVVASLATHRNDIDTALAAVGQLAQQLNTGSGTITAGINALEPALQVLSTENGDLTDLVNQVTQLAVVAQSVASTSGQLAVADVQALHPVLDQLVGVEQQIGPAFTDLAHFESLTPKIAPGDYLQLSLNAQAVLSNPPAGAARPASGDGAAVSTLLGGGLP